MQPILQRNIPGLSGKTREECAEIIFPLVKTDSKLKFYRKLFPGIFILTPAFVAAFYGSHEPLTTAFFTGAFIAVIASTYLQLFCFNPRLKEILGSKKV